MTANFDAFFDDAIFNNNALGITHAFEAKLESIADNNLCEDELIDLQSSLMSTN